MVHSLFTADLIWVLTYFQSGSVSVHAFSAWSDGSLCSDFGFSWLKLGSLCYLFLNFGLFFFKFNLINLLKLFRNIELDTLWSKGEVIFALELLIEFYLFDV
jgi:hypothetical protein